MDGWMNGWVDGRTIGWLHGCTDGHLPVTSATFRCAALTSFILVCACPNSNPALTLTLILTSFILVCAGPTRDLPVEQPHFLGVCAEAGELVLVLQLGRGLGLGLGSGISVTVRVISAGGSRPTLPLTLTLTWRVGGPRWFRNSDRLLARRRTDRLGT